MRNLILFALITLLTACGSLSGSGGGKSKSDDKNVEEYSGAQYGQEVSCSGFKEWPECFSAARQACPKGYEILAQEENMVTQARTLRFSCTK
ncbi:MAG: hypothetical protein LBE24_00220 [Methylobacillus sp.]|jgi:hypothetical protein|nr:hypothetical protein [Methylobacillus sp.]